MQKDAIHYNGWEHRDVHNINGMLFVGRILLLRRYQTHSYKLAQPHNSSTHRAFDACETPLRSLTFFLRGLPAFQRHLDRRQPRYMGAHGRWDTHGSQQRYRRYDICWR